ncbi:MAG: M48 family metalloprotease [Bauldia sp.]|nr:M48 family metalloprotease [Bauldia sp.]
MGAQLGQTRVRRTLFGRMLAPLALALALAGCAGVTTPTEVVTTAPVRAAPSGQHAQIIQAYGGVYSDPELERTLARIVGRLVAASDDPSRSYTITVLNAAAVNAFALPDGKLYVTRGLLALANDSSEVAAVLAHEMAHVTANHAALRQEQVVTAQIVGEVVRDVIEDEAAGQTALVTSQQTLAGFSRQQELEADAIGIRTVARAGYDPYAASRFLSAMSRFAAYRAASGVRHNERPEFLSSHPNNPERIDAAVVAARQIGAPGVGEVDRERYLAGLDGVVFGDDTRQGYVRGRSFYHADLAIAFTVPQGWAIENTQEAVLATGPDGTALRFDSVELDIGQTLPDYLLSGWINGLDRASVQSTAINGLPAATASAAAQGWSFRITLVQVGAQTYRFIFANDSGSSGLAQAAAAISGSFRQLSAQEAAGLRPLTIDIVMVVAGDTPQSLAQRMQGVENPLALFLILNGLNEGATLQPGTTVKIVTD